MKISCVVKQVVYFLPNGFSFHAPLCWLSSGSFTSRIWSQDPVVGWQIWGFLIESCVCVSPVFYAERAFFRGGVETREGVGRRRRGRWKKDLMNGDSQNGGCGSLTTQAGWIELRLTETWPLSSHKHCFLLHAGGTFLFHVLDFFFSGDVLLDGLTSPFMTQQTNCSLRLILFSFKCSKVV